MLIEPAAGLRVEKGKLSFERLKAFVGDSRLAAYPRDGAFVDLVRCFRWRSGGRVDADVDVDGSFAVLRRFGFSSAGIDEGPEAADEGISEEPWSRDEGPEADWSEATRLRLAGF